MIGQNFIKISMYIQDANMLTSPLEAGHPALTAFAGFCESIRFKTGLSFESFSPFVSAVQNFYGNPKPSRVGPDEEEGKLSSAKNATLKLTGNFTGGVILAGGLLVEDHLDEVRRAVSDRRALGGHIESVKLEYFNSATQLRASMRSGTFLYSLFDSREIGTQTGHDALDQAIALKSFVGKTKISDGVYLVNQVGFAKLHPEERTAKAFNKGKGFFVEPIMAITKLVPSKQLLLRSDEKYQECFWKATHDNHGFYLIQEGVN